MSGVKASAPVKTHYRRIRHIDPYSLSPGESASYWSGEWIGAAVPSNRLPGWRHKSGVTNEQAAAELAARVRLMLGER